MNDYARGRADEHTATIYVLERLLKLGQVSVDQANTIIDYLNVIDRREK